MNEMDQSVEKPHDVHVFTSEMFQCSGLLVSRGSAKKVQNLWQLLAFCLQTSGHCVVWKVMMIMQ